MHPSASVTIPQPCTQSWGAMTPAAQGRYCAACEQTVVDFSTKTAAEVLAYLTQPSRENACGRFRTSQLGQPRGC